MVIHELQLNIRYVFPLVTCIKYWPYPIFSIGSGCFLTWGSAIKRRHGQDWRLSSIFISP